MSTENFPGVPLPGGELEMMGRFSFKTDAPTLDESISRILDEPTYENLDEYPEIDPWQYSATDEEFEDD